MKRFAQPLSNERGVAIPLMGVAFLVIIGFTGLGVDIGRLAVVADEVQNAADVAATAGAKQLFSPNPDTDTPREQAVAVLSENEISNTKVGSGNLKTLESGNYADGVFTSNLEPINAVRAEVEFTADNIVFAGFGHPTSIVTKEAIAAFSPSGSGRPTIPIAVGDCLLTECDSSGCNVSLGEVPNLNDNSAWTGYFSSASASQIQSFFPAECGGDPSTVPLVEVGDDINLLNGQSVPLLRTVDCMLDAGLTEVTLPVVPCKGGTLSQAREVVGFATFDIQAVRTSGGHKGIDLKGIASTMGESGGGGRDFGSGKITMVR